MIGRTTKRERQRELAITQALQQDYTQLFVDVARALTSTLKLEDVLTNIMEKMAQFFGNERWSMMLVDKEKNELYYVIAVGEDSTSLSGLRVPMGEGIAGWVAHTGNPMVVPDTTVEPKWIEFERKHPGLNVRSIACLPVRSAQGVVGVIQLLNSKIDLLSDTSIQFLRVLCDFSAIAVRNAADMKRIHELSITDDCTGLFNARHLYTSVAELLETATDHPFSLLFFDIDHFKRINDVYGHLVGSRLLAEIGVLVKSWAGADNPAFRYGGDEFVVLLPDHDKERGTAVARSLFRSLRKARFLADEHLHLELRGSFGMATYPEDGTTIDRIIKSADDMMYHVKGTTRDNLAVAGHGTLFSPGTIDAELEPALPGEDTAPPTQSATPPAKDTADAVSGFPPAPSSTPANDVGGTSTIRPPSALAGDLF